MKDPRTEKKNGVSNRKTKKGGGGAFLALLIIFVLPRLVDALDHLDFNSLIWRLRYWAAQNRIDPELIPVILTSVLVLIVVFAVFSAAGKKRTAAGKAAAQAAPDRAIRRPDPRTKSFTPPVPSCIVCDHTGEDHFMRDKAQRIAQLDEWLKNGIIDRAEYKVLLDRFERDL